MVDKQISIKFGGGCNPRIDRGRIAEEVRKLLCAQGYHASCNRLDADCVIYISGCTANCAQRYNSTNAFFVVVAGAAIDSMAVAEEELAAEILSRVRGYFE